jgi:hypothetical protein
VFQITSLRLGLEYSHSLKLIKAAFVRKKRRKEYEILSLKTFRLLSFKEVKLFYTSRVRGKEFFTSLSCPSSFFSKTEHHSPSSVSKKQGLQNSKTWGEAFISPYLHKKEKTLYIRDFSSGTATTDCFTYLKKENSSENIESFIKQADQISFPHENIHALLKAERQASPCLILLLNFDQAYLISISRKASLIKLPFNLSSFLTTHDSEYFNFCNSSDKSIFSGEKYLRAIQQFRLHLSQFNLSLPCFVLGDACLNVNFINSLVSSLGLNLSPSQKDYFINKKGYFSVAIGSALRPLFSFRSIGNALFPIKLLKQSNRALNLLASTYKNLGLIVFLFLIPSLHFMNEQKEAALLNLSECYVAEGLMIDLEKPIKNNLTDIAKFKSLRRKQNLKKDFQNKSFVEVKNWIQDSFSPLSGFLSVVKLSIKENKVTANKKESSFKIEIKIKGKADAIRPFIKNLYKSPSRGLSIKNKIDWKNEQEIHSIHIQCSIV